MKFSLLVPRKADHGIRDHHWSLVKKRYQKLMPEVEICTGHDNSKLFCRSKAVNEAAKKATGNIMIIVDADVIFEPELLEKIAAVIHLHPWIIPYKTGIFLTKEATNRFIKKGLPAKVKIKAEDIERSYLGKGQLINVMKRECFEAVQGMDERFSGWGLEDFAFRVALDTICGKHFNMDQNVYHLWHPRAKRNHINASNNKNLYLRYLEAEDDVIKMNKLISERFK
jgi:predicted glycosyltransferase involved in capsule biosynthesis